VSPLYKVLSLLAMYMSFVDLDCKIGVWQLFMTISFHDNFKMILIFESLNDSFEELFCISLSVNYVMLNK